VSEYQTKKTSKEKWIWGRHSVEALLETNPEWILELIHLSEEEHADLLGMAADHAIACLKAAKMPSDLRGKRHQGIVAKIKRFAFEYFNQQEEQIKTWVKEGAVFAVLDRIQDPQNYGAIIRSAAGMGLKAILVPQKHQCPLTGVVAQASAGTAFRLPLILCPSLAKSIEFLKSEGSQILAMDMKGEDISDLELSSGSKTWILGSEGEGLKPELLKTADRKVSIPLSQGVESLNVSVSAALAFFVSRR